MSDVTSLILRVAITLGGVLSVAWSVHYVAKVLSPMPQTDAAKEAVLQPLPSPPEHHTEKVRGPLSASVASLSSSGDGTLVLEATVRSQKPVQNVQTQWVLPYGMALVAGHLNNTLDLVGPNTPKSIQITVQSGAGNSGPIHFIAKGANGGTRFSAVRQFSPTSAQPASGKWPRVAF